MWCGKWGANALSYSVNAHSMLEGPMETLLATPRCSMHSWFSNHLNTASIQRAAYCSTKQGQVKATLTTCRGMSMQNKKLTIPSQSIDSVMDELSLTQQFMNPVNVNEFSFSESIYRPTLCSLWGSMKDKVTSINQRH